MSLQDWKARTGDTAFVDKVSQLVNRLLDKPEPAPVTRAIAALEVLRKAPAGDATPRALAARQEMLDMVVTALEALVTPDPDGVGAYIDNLAARLRSIGADLIRGRNEEARRDAAALAEEIADLPPEAFAALANAEPAPAGLAAVLGLLPAGARHVLAEALGAPMIRDAAYGADVCQAVLADATANAADAGTVLDPDSVPSLVLAAIAGGGASEAYARAVGDAAPENLTGLVEALGAQAVPSAVSRPLLALHDTLAGRFGPGIGLAAARGHLLLRVIGPALADDLTAALTALLRDGPAPEQVAIEDALTVFTDHVLAAGRAAEDIALTGGDPDDLIGQRGAALDSAEHLAAAFLPPTPADPLGTLPANPVTLLGQAILRARAARPDGYDWGAVAALETGDPLMHAALLHDERIEVIDLVEIEGGLDTTTDDA